MITSDLYKAASLVPGTPEALSTWLALSLLDATDIKVCCSNPPHNLSLLSSQKCPPGQPAKTWPHLKVLYHNYIPQMSPPNWFTSPNKPSESLSLLLLHKAFTLLLPQNASLFSSPGYNPYSIKSPAPCTLPNPDQTS